MLRIIRELQPAWVIAENVGGLITWSDGLVFETVCTDLETAGYEVQPFLIPAAGVGAPHRRDRIWFVAHTTDNGCIGEMGLERQPNAEAAEYSNGDSDVADPSSERRQQESRSTFGDEGENEGWPTQDYYESPGDYQSPATDAESTEPSEPRPKPYREQIGRTDCSSTDWDRDWREIAFATCVHRVDDGLPERLVRFPDGSEISQARWRKEALKAYGNAIVPAVAIEIMTAIRDVMNYG